jgi:hypothetical protein
MKGMQVQPVLAISIFFTAILIFGVIFGFVSRTGGYVKQETLGIKADHVLNTALSVDSMPEGSITVDMEDYGFKLSNNLLHVSYGDSQVNKSLELLKNSYDNIEGPTNFRKIDSHLLIEKTEENGEETLRFAVDEEG